MERALLFVFLSFYRFEVFGFENLAAVEALHIVDSVPARDYLGAGVVTSGGLHGSTVMRIILTAPFAVSSPL